MLTDVVSGEDFTLADFAGKVVYVEPMATWCPPCRDQLSGANTVLRRFANDNVVYIALSLEPTLDPADLASYARQNSFELKFAIAIRFCPL